MKLMSFSRKKSGSSVLKKTFKSYSPNERILSGFLGLVLLFSGWKLISGDWKGQNIVNVIWGGHTYSEGMVGEIIRLNPIYADLNEIDRDITSLIFEGLSKYDPDQKKVVENMATHTLDEAKTLYTFVLRDGLKWHDGISLTAEDVYFTYHDVIQNPEFENSVLKSTFAGVEVKMVNEKTITMKLSEPNSFFFTQLTVGILPKHLLADVSITELDSVDFNREPIGNGSYKVTGAYDVLENGITRVTLTYNKDYWQAKQPDITEITFLAFPNFETLLKSRGEVHGIARISKYLLEKTQTDNFTAYEYSLPQYTALFMDTDKEILSDRRVRLAIQKAIDKKAIIQAIGYSQNVDTPLLELNQEDWIYQTNPEEAAGALYDAGFELDDDLGFRVKKNEDGSKEVLALTLLRRAYSDNPQSEEVNKITSEILVEQLTKIGIQVTIKSYEGAQFQTRVKDQDYDLLLYGQNLGYNLDTYAYWHSSQAKGKGLNLSNYTNPKADFYIEAIRNTFDNEVAKPEYLRDLAEIFKNDIPAVLLYRPTYYFLIDPRIKNIHTQNLLFPQDRFANILNWVVE
ncbi:MAG: hypothetical protein UT55_C0015G0005 [Candidatus Peregrinibacteria bacterium GW2011_GWE2_39_6]|nr:MAG: hypothetical protein UT36_C0010G0047 [Candidatus Peregrinibacteria bacterium GW2011_GWF2_39_17]KKR26175.1 MAG: hypothetical protein UT55_C0015G0005 [Candidatus Peregrinibacteria bacterium GW2011_GWE2_39_6]HCW32293.1 hypothetical protein [Candidatus Peregrinibacteria bacterium]